MHKNALFLLKNCRNCPGPGALPLDPAYKPSPNIPGYATAQRIFWFKQRRTKDNF